jgi:hypothetical protein
MQWISEIAHFSPGVPILLVGCKLDLRASPGHLANLESTGVSPMTVAQVRLCSRPIILYLRAYTTTL